MATNPFEQTESKSIKTTSHSDGAKLSLQAQENMAGHTAFKPTTDNSVQTKGNSLTFGSAYNADGNSSSRTTSGADLTGSQLASGDANKYYWPEDFAAGKGSVPPDAGGATNTNKNHGLTPGDGTTNNTPPPGNINKYYLPNGEVW